MCETCQDRYPRRALPNLQRQQAADWPEPFTRPHTSREELREEAASHRVSRPLFSWKLKLQTAVVSQSYIIWLPLSLCRP